MKQMNSRKDRRRYPLPTAALRGCVCRKISGYCATGRKTTPFSYLQFMDQDQHF